MAFAFRPTNANSIDVSYGIQNLLSGYILQNEDITETADKLVINDQAGRTAQVIAYQKHYGVNLTMIGPDTPPTSAGAVLSWKKLDGSNISVIVDSCTKSSVYNDTAKWKIDGEAYINATYHDKTDSPL